MFSCFHVTAGVTHDNVEEHMNFRHASSGSTMGMEARPADAAFVARAAPCHACPLPCMPPAVHAISLYGTLDKLFRGDLPYDLPPLEFVPSVPFRRLLRPCPVSVPVERPLFAKATYYEDSSASNGSANSCSLRGSLELEHGEKPSPRRLSIPCSSAGKSRAPGSTGLRILHAIYGFTTAIQTCSPVLLAPRCT